MHTDKKHFILLLKEFAKTLTDYVSTESGDWTIKGFIDIQQQVYTISSDSKIVSKILEIQLFPKFKAFAESIGYEIILAEKQNWYPDLSFVKIDDPNIKFAVDIKTTYPYWIMTVFVMASLWGHTVNISGFGQVLKIFNFLMPIILYCTSLFRNFIHTSKTNGY